MVREANVSPNSEEPKCASLHSHATKADGAMALTLPKLLVVQFDPVPELIGGAIVNYRGNEAF